MDRKIIKQNDRQTNKQAKQQQQQATTSDNKR